MGGFEMNREEQIVFNEIDNHRGREKAISVPMLTRRVNIHFNGDPITELKVRKIVRGLRVDHGMPIGSATDYPPGYYIITDKEELKKAVKTQRKRGLSILKRPQNWKAMGENISLDSWIWGFRENRVEIMGRIHDKSSNENALTHIFEYRTINFAPFVERKVNVL